MNISGELFQIQKMIKERIEEYAKEHGISYEEAAKKAYLTINGVKITSVNAEDLKIDEDKDENS